MNSLFYTLSVHKNRPTPRSFFEVLVSNKEVKSPTRFCFFSWFSFLFVGVGLFLIFHATLERLMQTLPRDLLFLPRIASVVFSNAFIYLFVLPNIYTESSPRATPWTIIRFFQGKKELVPMQSYVAAMLRWLPVFFFFCLLYWIYDYLALQSFSNMLNKN